MVDFAMNEACAAGTGSFLEEQAEKLGINIIGEFAELALGSEAPVRLGERCTVFMERDVNSYLQRGARQEDLVAGLAYSIASNYLNRLVARAPHRRHHLLPGRHRLQRLRGGGVQQDPGARKSSCRRTTAWSARSAWRCWPARGCSAPASPRGSAAGIWSRWTTPCVEFTCKGCSNECDIRQFTIGGEKTYWGDKCSDRYRKRAKVDKEPVIRDLVAFREEHAAGAVRGGTRSACRSGAPTVGHPPRHVHVRPPALLGDVLPELGFASCCRGRPTRRSARRASRLTVAEPCFPIRVAHGHVAELFERASTGSSCPTS